MARKDIQNELDRKNRNNHNNNYKELYQLKKTINDLVLNSGESNAEVVQARAGEDTLNDRLDNMTSATKQVDSAVSSLKRETNEKLDNKADLGDLDNYTQEMEDNLSDALGNAEFKGVMLSLTRNTNVEHAEWTTVEWDKSDYNLSGFWNDSKKSQIIIPEGVKKVRVSCNVLWDSNSDGARRVRSLKNGGYSKGLFYLNNIAGGTSPLGATSGVIEVTEGDYFELEVYQSSGEERTLREDPYTWLSLEVVEYGKK